MFEITEERLREIEEEGCGARPFRQELKMLISAYRSRDTIKGLHVTKGADGAWLNFEDENDNKACISVECLASDIKSPIISNVLRNWQGALLTNEK